MIAWVYPPSLILLHMNPFILSVPSASVPWKGADILVTAEANPQIVTLLHASQKVSFLPLTTSLKKRFYHSSDFFKAIHDSGLKETAPVQMELVWGHQLISHRPDRQVFRQTSPLTVTNIWTIWAGPQVKIKSEKLYTNVEVLLPWLAQL